MRSGVITGVSVAHGEATVDEIEAASAPDVRERIAELLATPGVAEAFAIQTCNRSEAYVVTDRAEQGRAALDDIADDVRSGVVERMDHETSLRHLMRLASGLESLVLGEDQIIGQLRDAVETARGEDGIGPMLDDTLMKAIHVGERARTETAINEGVVSLGSGGGHARRPRGRPRRRDRTRRRGRRDGHRRRRIAGRHRNRPVGDRQPDGPTCDSHRRDSQRRRQRGRPPGPPAAAAEASVVVSATGSPEPILDADDLADSGETVCIDLGQPRDIDPAAADHDAVAVHDIDALEAITDRTHARRAEAAEAVEEMINEEFDRLLALFKRKRADAAISAMYEGAERVKQREVRTAVAKLDSHGEVTDEQREIIESLADSLVSQLLSAPTKSLRDAAANDDWTTIQTAMQLFNPEFDEVPEIDPDDTEAAEGKTDAEEADTTEASDGDEGSVSIPDAIPDGVDTVPDSLDDIPDSVEKEMPAHVLEQLSED
jgi:Glutamyl-tRNA reductase